MRTILPSLGLMCLLGCNPSRPHEDSPPPVPTSQFEPGIEVVISAPINAFFSTGNGTMGCNERGNGAVGWRDYSCVFPTDSAVNTLHLQFYDGLNCTNRGWTFRLIGPAQGVQLTERVPTRGCYEGWDVHVQK